MFSTPFRQHSISIEECEEIPTTMMKRATRTFKNKRCVAPPTLEFICVRGLDFDFKEETETNELQSILFSFTYLLLQNNIFALTMKINV